MFMKGLGIKGGYRIFKEEKRSEMLCRGFKILQSESYKNDFTLRTNTQS